MFNLNRSVTRGDNKKIPVLSVAVIRSVQTEHGVAPLEVPYLEIIAPPGSFTFNREPRDAVKWEGWTWVLDEFPEDYNNGPWWAPGLNRFIFKSPIVKG